MRWRKRKRSRSSSAPEELTPENHWAAMRRRLEAGTATDDDAAQMLAALDALFARAGEFVSLETHWRRIHTVTRLLRNGDRATLARLIEGGHNGGPEDDGNVYN